MSDHLPYAYEKDKVETKWAEYLTVTDLNRLHEF